MTQRQKDSDYQYASEDSFAEHLEAVPPVVGRLVVCEYTTTCRVTNGANNNRHHVNAEGFKWHIMSPATRNS